MNWNPLTWFRRKKGEAEYLPLQPQPGQSMVKAQVVKIHPDGHEEILQEDTRPQFGHIKKPGRYRWPTYHVFVGIQTRSCCGKISREDERVVITDEPPDGTLCGRCNWGLRYCHVTGCEGKPKHACGVNY